MQKLDSIYIALPSTICNRLVETFAQSNEIK